MAKLKLQEGKYYQEATIIMLPVGYSRISLCSDKLSLAKGAHYGTNTIQPQHLYFLSNEEVTESNLVKGDYYYDVEKNKVFQFTRAAFPNVIVQEGDSTTTYHCANISKCKKIIATTATLVILSIENIQNQNVTVTVPKPSTSFIDKYIELYNTDDTIEEVLVEYTLDSTMTEMIKLNHDDTIIIKKKKKLYSEDEMHMNMQYYMEYCRKEEYITPKQWITSKKHF